MYKYNLYYLGINQDGTVLNFNPMFVKRISMTGEVEHLNWYDRYIKLRSRAGIEFPGKHSSSFLF